MARASSRFSISGTPLRSAPTAKMNGLPVTPTAAMSSRPAIVSMAAFSSARPLGPNVLGLVWSWPLSSVMSASARAVGECYVPYTRVCDDLVREDFSKAAHLLSSQLAFSQRTVPPMPMPTHIVVSP